MSFENRALLEFDQFRLDLSQRVLYRDGETLPLTPKAFDVLAALVSGAGRIIEKEELVKTVWPDTFVEEANLSVQVSILRKALGETPDSNRFIETIPRRGYRFTAVVREVEAEPGRVANEATGFTDAMGTAVPKHRIAAWLWATGATSLLLIVGWLVLKAYVLHAKPVIPFQEKDWVLITDLDNRTGEAVFDGAVETALAMELSNSRYLNVVPRERVKDALLLMRKPLDTRVDIRVGQEVCQRDGAIKVLLWPRAEKLGSKYVLRLGLVNPADGVVMASDEASAKTQDEVLSALSTLARWAREGLGENLKALKSPQIPLEKVTTSSLRALQLYTQADALMHGSGKQEAPATEELLKQAVAEDPEFASAYILLAWEIRRHLRPMDEFLPFARRALELSNKCSETERYFIRGSYYAMTGDKEKALAAFATLVQLNPNHYWGVNDFTLLQGDPGKIVQVEMNRAKLRPNDFFINWQTAKNSISIVGDWEQALPYAKRAFDLFSNENIQSSVNLFTATQLRLFRFYTLWKNEKVGEAESELERLTNSGTLEFQVNNEYGQQAIALVAYAYLTLGKLQAARRWYQESSLSHPGIDLEYARLAYFSNDMNAFKAIVAKLADITGNIDWQADESTFLARTGNIDAAKRLQLKIGHDPIYAIDRELQGEIALAQGRLKDAIELLSEAVRQEPSSAHYYLSVEALALAWEKRGDLSQAIRVLEYDGRQRFRILADQGPYWLHNQALLAQFYRKAGRVEIAGRVEEELRRLLACADPDHPIVRQLRNMTH